MKKSVCVHDSRKHHESWCQENQGIQRTGHNSLDTHTENPGALNLRESQAAERSELPGDAPPKACVCLPSAKNCVLNSQHW